MDQQFAGVGEDNSENLTTQRHKPLDSIPTAEFPNNLNFLEIEEK